MPALVVAHVLQGLIATAVLLLAAFVWHERAMLASCARAGAPRLARWLQRGGTAVLALSLLLAAADVLLPAEVNSTRLDRSSPLGNGAIEVSFGTCCTGGGTGSCQVRPADWVREGQPVEVRQSAVLGRCTVEPRSLERPCHCS